MMSGEWMGREQLEERFIAAIARVLEKRGLKRAVKLDQPLNEMGLGLDSMGRLDLLIEVEKEFQMEFAEEYWGTDMFRTPNEILYHIQERL